MHRAVLRTSLLAVPPKACASGRTSQWVRGVSSRAGERSLGAGGRGLILLSVLAISAGAGWYVYPILSGSATSSEGGARRQSTKVPLAELEFEKQRRKPSSKEEHRDLLSSQHLQVKKSWENPGVYAWGSNSGRVVAPESADAVVKTPRRITFFDGEILRDLKLDRNFGVAVTEEGDLVQWGTAFAADTTTPVRTLTGKDIAKVAISADRIIALSRGGTVYSLPVARADQQSGAKAKESSWVPFWSSTSSISYRTLDPESLSWGEKVTDIKSGLEHCLLLTSKGRVFSAASSTENFPSKGQLGIPGLTWATKLKGRYDQPHEIRGLPSAGIAQIATGSYHSLALDKESRVFAWGDNSAGQLGVELNTDQPSVDVPLAVPLEKLYRGLRPSVTSIAAGGANSFFSIESSQPTTGSGQGALNRGPSRVIADIWACGEGIYGSLGTGKWTHISKSPTKIKALSGLSEYDDKTQQIVPIRLASLSVGSTHAAAILNNITSLSASGDNKGSPNSTNWGADVLWWGGNEFYQLGTGKRNNLNEPTYIPPLDRGKGDAEYGSKGETYRLQITPKKTVRLGEEGRGRKVCMEQKVECGRYVTAVYSGMG